MSSRTPGSLPARQPAGGIHLHWPIRWWVMGSVLLVLWVVANLDKVGLSVIVTNRDYLKALGIAGAPVRIGLLFTAFTVATVASSVLAGWAVDRWGSRRAAAVGATLWGVSMAVGALASTYGGALASRLLLGMAEAVVWPLSNRWVRQWYPAQERTRAQALALMGLFLGPALAGPVLAGAMASGGWRAAFWVSAAISVAVVLPVIGLTRETPADHPWVSAAERAPIADTSPAAAESAWAFLGRGPYWAAVIAYVCAGILFFGVSSWLPTYLQHRGAGNVGAWTGLAWGMACLGLLAAGTIADKTRRPAATGSLALAAGAIFLAVLARGGDPGWMAVAAGVVLAADGAATAISQALLQRFVPAAGVGRATGVLVTCGSLVGGLAPTAMGWLVQHAGGSFASAFFALGAAAAVGATALAWVWATEAPRR